MTDEAARERHRQRMQRQKELVDARIARADQDCGVLVVNTGNGKGKSSAAFGMVARALGHGMTVAVVQFIKGSFSTGEEAFFRRFPDVEFHVMGEGFTWETQDAELDRRAALAAWDKAAAFLADPSVQMVVMDELNIALKLGLVPTEAVLDALQNRPAHQHAVVTGRAAPQDLIDIADTVTEMRPIKHAFDAGIMAQKGVEL
ncbi:cob(I)yrinic acid a,c-diamide adenosyltransferase [uncultured Thiocystis sp.]|jgi:cob(I)alamin adenosyltransferase|uniref:cob(I)yrinic acid a,c-diamide adenosyltransferase n=1 Tax=uncultured Thiocystis sp. TaxID=1202134 RepID=UPI00260064D9|nr:cob(I)yrinic acid a,c-diamide adenosyltransferase [uncultured Thiocystis sp.]